MGPFSYKGSVRSPRIRKHEQIGGSVSKEFRFRYVCYSSQAHLVLPDDVAIDYIDLYLIHDPLSGKVKRLETYRALLDAQKAGKIRTVGVSN